MMSNLAAGNRLRGRQAMEGIFALVRRSAEMMTGLASGHVGVVVVNGVCVQHISTASPAADRSGFRSRVAVPRRQVASQGLTSARACRLPIIERVQTSQKTHAISEADLQCVVTRQAIAFGAVRGDPSGYSICLSRLVWSEVTDARESYIAASFPSLRRTQRRFGRQIAARVRCFTTGSFLVRIDPAAIATPRPRGHLLHCNQAHRGLATARTCCSALLPIDLDTLARSEVIFLCFLLMLALEMIDEMSVQADPFIVSSLNIYCRLLWLPSPKCCTYQRLM
uniref:Uncharacterized protein n=1 Tax=Setaria viridis TaxID=4556 RepID=A0A4U6WH97_SETVI|nr:hypothetical protein SEVIR_1G295900v2 [Setaria viridis]